MVELNEESDAVSTAEVSFDDDDDGIVGDRKLLDIDGDGTVDTTLIQVFGPNGLLVRQTRIEDSDHDGTPDRIDSITFDFQGVETSKTLSQDTDDDGVLDETLSIGFHTVVDPRGHRMTRGNFIVYDTDNDGTVNWRDIVHFDDQFRILMWEEEHDTDDDGTLDRRETYTHGIGGHGGRLPLMLRLETNTDDSGAIDRVVTETYSYYTNQFDCELHHQR